MTRPRPLARPLPAPRWQTPLPPGTVGSWGPFVTDYARRELGIELDRWQARAINRALATDAAGRLVHRLYLTSCGRQNGKTVGVRSLVGATLTVDAMPDTWSVVLGLAHDKKQARIPYTAVHDDLLPIRRRLRRGLAVTRYLGIRSELYGRHREYDVASREARDAIRSMSVDLGVFDEVRTQRNYDTWAALEPTTRARPEPLIFAISTAGDDRSVLLRDWWERGLRIIAGAEPAEGFGMTWYAAPDDLEPDDRRAILAANPAVAEGRVPLAPVAASFRSLPFAQYRAETLNLWTEGGDEILPPGVWRDATAPQPERRHGRLVLAVDASPTWRRATIAVVMETGRGTAWLGVAGDLDAARLGLSTLEPRRVQDEIARLCRDWKPDALAWLATAAVGPYAKAAGELRHVRQLIALTATNLRAASAMWRSELVAGRLAHEDDPLLAQQLRTARPSSPVDAGDWYLSTRESLGDIDSTRAGAFATWAALAPEARRVPQVF